MTSIANPIYKTDGKQFNVEFFKHNDESLSLSIAKKYFVSFVGLNILKGYYFFRNAVISDDQIIGSDVISNGNIVGNKITSNQIVASNITANKIYCDEIVVSNPLHQHSLSIPAIFGYFYVNNMSLPITGSDSNIASFCGSINLKQSQINILLLPKVKIIFYNSILTNNKKLCQNKAITGCKLVTVDLSLFLGFQVYFDNILK